MGIPSSTYRLQLRADFPFAAAEAVIDYLDELGVGAVYTSPVLRSARGSPHGYDLVDPTRIDPALGGDEAFADWAAAVGRRGLARIVDFVPNHIGVGTGENAWWNDVLQNGQSSLFADFFDIDWEPPKRALHGKVLLPILSVPYGEALEQGQLRVRREGGAFFVECLGRHLPLSPTTWPVILREAARACGPETVAAQALQEVAASLEALPASHEVDRARRLERARGRGLLELCLRALFEEAPDAAAAVGEVLVRINGRVGERCTFDALDGLLQAQSYRLSDWRVAPDEINYRRFFDVSDLAAVRMEDPEVFAAMHGLVLRLAADGHIDGLRLDHTDGLREPTAYFVQLRRALVEARGTEGGRATYVVAEKILEPGESLPRAWPIDGTTGYDFLGEVGGLWVDPAGEGALTEMYRAQTGSTASYEATVWGAKRLIMRTILSSEVHALSEELERLATGRRRSRDFTLRSLTMALVETLAALDVYRTYVRADGGREAADEGRLRAATTRAKRQCPHLDPSVFDFVEDMALLRTREDLSRDQRAAQVHFSMRFQQLSGAVMAKGVEDTTYYRYSRLLSLNEVGARPGAFGVSIADFHAANVHRRELWKGSMLATSTHDTKRGEDARARLAVLSEIPEVWRARVAEWNVLAESHLTATAKGPAPSPADRYYFYQAMVGALPFEDALHVSDDFIRRACDHMAKATKEAKRETSWVRPDAGYDEAVRHFVTGMLTDPVFAACLRGFVHSVAAAGASNALGQVTLKLTSPGVADVYQGTELWSFDFCDPDNRRPVDYDLRRRYLAALRSPPSPVVAAELLRKFEDGRIKMHVCHTLLRLRRAHPALFIEGSYVPVDAGDGAVAFARQGGGMRLVAVCARGVSKRTNATHRWAVGSAWGDTRMAVEPGELVDVLTGRTLVSRGELPLRDVLEVLPVAVLVA